MSIGEICSREVVFIRRTESVLEAAKLMRHHHVGSLVVAADRPDGRRVPVGVITDRDIAVGVVALALDPAATQVEGAMRGDPATVREDESIGRAIKVMRAHGVRRLPVVDATGALVGVLAVDDLLQLLGEELGHLAAIVPRGTRREREERRVA